ncbi:MAG: hypothetical protein AAF085_00530 [Planctomycetota bacterium]
MARRTQKKKKSNNGIWVGSGVSLAIIMLLTFAFYMKGQPDPPDRPSGAITTETLAKQRLKTSGLPKIAEAPGGSGSLGDLLGEAKAVENFLTAGGPTPAEKAEKAKPVIAALHGAAASDMSKGILDSKIPAKYFDSPEVKSSFSAVGAAVRVTIDNHIEQIEFDQADAVAMSYIKLGQKIFENNTRLKSRERGLAVMESGLLFAGKVIQERLKDGEIDQDEFKERNAKVMEWNRAVSAVRNAWKEKLRPIESVNSEKRIPNTSDLVRVAKEDEDLTFRIWAARRLGYAMFERKDPGNLEVIKTAIEELKNDSNKQVAKAAAEGEKIKDTDEYYELRK